MDISADELRTIEIKEEKRHGYNRDDVDELLERGAATIERLIAENQQLRSRLSQGSTSPAKPAPAAPAAPAAPNVERNFDTSAIQRTLVLAQQVADEAVADARAQAQKIVGDAQSQAQQLVAGAESRAAEIAENERQKLEDEINTLQSARATLGVDVDALEAFEREYRDRLRNALEAELDSFSRMLAGGAQRPGVHPISLPSPSSDQALWSQAGVQVKEESGSPANWDPSPAGGWANDESAPAPGDESLDDDAFFASLRDAVREEAPLGAEAVSSNEDTGEQRKLFKRRK